MKTSLSEAFGDHAPHHSRALAGGAVVGIVTNTTDPDDLARVKVRFPTLSDDDESFWARVAVPMAGDGHGVRFPLAINDEVLVIFGHLREPYVVGAMWNGKDVPPTDDQDVSLIRSRSGHVIRLTDKAGSEMVEIIDHTGKNSVVIDTSDNTITISADMNIELAAPNGSITLSAKKIAISATVDAEIKAGNGGVTLRSDGNVTVKGQAINLN